MFRLDVLHNQWLVAALGGGIVLALCVALYYLAMWRQRPDGGWPRPAEERAGRGRMRGAVPGLLVFTYGLVLAFILVFTWVVIRFPPNW
jgi:hypothetical protein